MKIKKVLMLADYTADNLAYMMFDGLYKVLGNNGVILLPYIHWYQGGCDQDFYYDQLDKDGNKIKGFVLPMGYCTGHSSPEIIYDEIVSMINSKKFDLIYLSSHRTYARKAFDQIRTDVNSGRINKDSYNSIIKVFSEVEDGMGLEYIQNIKKIYPEIRIIFKRGLLLEDYNWINGIWTGGNKEWLGPIYPLPFSALTDNLLPDKDEDNKDIDICCQFGNSYPPVREKLVKHLYESRCKDGQLLVDKYKCWIGIDHFEGMNTTDHTKPLNYNIPWNNPRASEAIKYLPWKEYIDKISRAKINIIARGNGFDTVRRWEAACYSGLVLSDRLPQMTPMPYMNNEHIVYYKDDLSDIVDLIEYYLSDKEGIEKRKQIGKFGKFHTYSWHTSDKRALWFLETIEKYI